MLDICFTVFGKPQPKERARIGLGRAYTPSKTKDYEFDIGWAAKAQMQGKLPIEGPVGVYFRAYLPIPESWAEKKKRAALEGGAWAPVKPDGDNIEKAVWDGISGIVFVDDKQVCDWSGFKKYAAAARVEIRVTSLCDA